MKIRGNTIGTPIKPEQNIIKATNLTEVEKEQARLNIGVDLNNYYDKEFIDPIIEDADRRLTNLEETAAQAVQDFETIVPPLVDGVEDLTKRVTTIEDNFYDGSYTDIEVYDGSVTKGVM